MKEVCEKCHIEGICLKKDPLKMDGSKPNVWYECVRYSCRAHLLNAIDISNLQDPLKFKIGKKGVKGWLFGSKDKKTHMPNERFNKFVSKNGDVYIKDSTGKNKWERTGQKFW